MITVLHYIISIYYTIHAHTYVYRYHNTTLLHYTTSSVLHHSITSHSICIIYITTQRVLPAHNIYPLLHYLTVYIKPYNDTLPITIFASTRYSISYISHHYLSIYLFISNTRYSHSSIPRCNNLSFINYTFIYAHKNSETKNQSAFATFHWSQKIIWIEICWQVMGARSPSKSGILSRVSSRGEEPDEYPDKQPVAWPARSISVQAQHPQPFFPSSQSASRFIPLWGNSSSFFFLLLFLPLSSNEASGFQGEDTLPVLGELILETRRRKTWRGEENQNCGIVYYIGWGKEWFFKSVVSFSFKFLILAFWFRGYFLCETIGIMNDIV